MSVSVQGSARKCKEVQGSARKCREARSRSNDERAFSGELLTGQRIVIIGLTSPEKRIRNKILYYGRG